MVSQILVERRASSPVRAMPLGNSRDHQGGKSDEIGLVGFIRAIFGDISYEIHRRSDFVHYHPRPLLS